MTTQTLRQEMNNRFSLSEIRTLCFDMGIDHEELGGGPKSEVIANLIAYCQRYERLHDLQSNLKQARPFVAWANLFAALPAARNAPLPPVGGNSIEISGDAYGPVQGNQGTLNQTFNFGAEPDRGMDKEQKDLAKVKGLMPDLIADMKKELHAKPTFREFILKSKNTIYNSRKPYVAYFFEDYEDLQDKIYILEGRGFVRDVAFNDVPRYRLQEKFVDLLLSD